MARLPQVGDVLDGRFRLEATLGQGAFGAVFRAVDLDRESPDVAVKVLFSRYQEDKKVLQRFTQEAKLLKELEHPSIATAFQSRADADMAFLVMELIDGISLDQRCVSHSEDGRHLPTGGIAWICDQLCSAVEFAHQKGVIHRDLKPRNVMVNRAGARPFVKVLDFGIAKVLVGGEVDPTTVGRILGSVLYIAPEQIRSQALDYRADVFSLGTIMFELITLRRAWARTDDGVPHPFHEPVPVGEMNNHVKILHRIAREDRPSACVLREDLSPAVDEVLHRALAIEPDERFGSAQDFAVAMRQALIEEHYDPSFTSSPQDSEPPTESFAGPTAALFGFGTNSHDTVLAEPAGAVSEELKGRSPSDSEAQNVDDSENRVPTIEMDAPEVSELRAASEATNDAVTAGASATERARVPTPAQESPRSLLIPVLVGLVVVVSALSVYLFSVG